jgi:hypothetical protein
MVVNPLIELISESLTNGLEDVFAATDPMSDLLVWIEKCIPHDADLDRSKMQLCVQSGVVKRNELRQWNGMVPLTDKEGGEELIPASSGGKQAGGGELPPESQLETPPAPNDAEGASNATQSSPAGKANSKQAAAITRKHSARLPVPRRRR